MRAISVLAAYKLASKTFVFHLMMFIVLWTFATPKCNDDTCTYFLTDALLKLKIMHAILFGTLLLIEIFQFWESTTKSLNDLTYNLATTVYELVKNREIKSLPAMKEEVDEWMKSYEPA